MTETPRDLAVRFGTQVRIKCPLCKKYMPQLGQMTCTCGAIWQQCPGAETFYVRLK